MMMIRQRLAPRLRRRGKVPELFLETVPRDEAPKVLPELHGEGHDHIIGGGGMPPVPAPDPEIDLADGTHITFATAGGARRG
jgi:hypothetical protein